ncbi:MAG TPA: hypothetical protein VHK88_00815 [Aquihabitans sp.]|nr:hypothetical protein [Aquihabitans sp.]
MKTTTWTDDHAVVAFDRSITALSRLTRAPEDSERSSEVADAVTARAASRIDHDLAGELRSSLALLAAVLLPIMVLASLTALL